LEISKGFKNLKTKFLNQFSNPGFALMYSFVSL